MFVCYSLVCIALVHRVLIQVLGKYQDAVIGAPPGKAPLEYLPKTRKATEDNMDVQIRRVAINSVQGRYEYATNTS